MSAAGLIGALAIHVLLVLPFVLDLSPSPRKLPDKSEAGASASYTAADPELTVVFINEPSPPSATTAPKFEPLSSRGLASRDLPVVILSPDASPAVQAAGPVAQETTDPSAAATDPAHHGLMFGRYVGQVQARIDRAWMRPRTEIGAPTFSCRARIEQDRQGGVLGVRLDHCNGTERWQQSLVSAIRTASPLPAPPDPSVYADVLWLSFQSDGFRAGGSPDGFEPQSQAALLAAEQSQVRESLEHVLEQAGRNFPSRDKESPDVIHLTIIGTPTAPAPAETPSAPAPEPDPEIPPATSSPH